MREDLHQTAEQVVERHRKTSTRTMARQRWVFKKVMRWIKRNHPDVYEKLRDQAYRKFPNQSGRKVKFDLAA